jgi:hypothetical protein
MKKWYKKGWVIVLMIFLVIIIVLSIGFIKNLFEDQKTDPDLIEKMRESEEKASYENIEVRIDCEDYRLASVEEWEMINFEVNDNIATLREFNYDITTQKICMDDRFSACAEACQNLGYSNIGGDPDNEVGQHVCICQ